MAQVINTNVLSLNAQRNLNRTQGDLATSLQRLSSGLRINSAKDDAAGLAISERFTTQIRGLNQAVRNANDGISLAQTAEGALAELGNNLQRIRELAVQAANATNSTSDRAALDQEVQQRLAEIDRIATQTAFNDQKLLDGSFGNATFQIGANVGQTINVSLGTSMRTSSIGKMSDFVGGDAVKFDQNLALGQQGLGVGDSALAEGELTIAVGNNSAVAIQASVAGSAPGQVEGSAYAKVQAINASGVSGLTAEANTTAVFEFETIDEEAYTLSINGVEILTGDYSDASVSIEDLAAKINAETDATGVTASVENDRLVLSAEDGRDITIEQYGADDETVATKGLTGSAEGVNNEANSELSFAAATSQVARGTIRLTATDDINVGGSNAAAIGYAKQSYADTEGLTTASVTTVENANTTITRIDAALQAVSGLRSQFGAIQNRFESTISNLQSTVENMSAARSRIQDTDFAAETASLTRAQILQQAGTAILAQANSAPQSVLSLLQ